MLLFNTSDKCKRLTLELHGLNHGKGNAFFRKAIRHFEDEAASRQSLDSHSISVNSNLITFNGILTRLRVALVSLMINGGHDHRIVRLELHCHASHLFLHFLDFFFHHSIKPCLVGRITYRNDTGNIFKRPLADDLYRIVLGARRE